MNDLMGLLLTRRQLHLLSRGRNVRVLDVQWNRLRFVVHRHFLRRRLHKQLVTAACTLLTKLSSESLLLSTKESLNTGQVLWSNHQNGHLLSVAEALRGEQFLDGHLWVCHRNYIQVFVVVGIVVDGSARWKKGQQRDADDGELESEGIKMKVDTLE